MLKRFLLPIYFLTAFSVFALFIIHNSLFTVSAQNFIGPTTAAGVGQGAIGVDIYRNISIGTSTPQSNTKFLIVGSTNDSSAYAFKILQLNQTPIFTVRNDGSIGINNSNPSYTLDVTGNARFTGTFTASNYTGSISSANVSAGIFGSNTGNGNFSFPANITASGTIESTSGGFKFPDG